MTSECQDVLNDPFLATPPIRIPQPKPEPQRIRVKRVRYTKFILLTDDFFQKWVLHRQKRPLEDMKTVTSRLVELVVDLTAHTIKHITQGENTIILRPMQTGCVAYAYACVFEVRKVESKTDHKPPVLYPEQYLKPQRLGAYVEQIAETTAMNYQMLQHINVLQRSGGYVDCWKRPTSTQSTLQERTRQQTLQEINRRNVHLQSRLMSAKSMQPSVADLNVFWAHMKEKMCQFSKLPFVMFESKSIDQGIVDPAFIKPRGVTRPRVMMEVMVPGRSTKIGRVIIELFTDICPLTCKLFIELVEGDSRGYGYNKTSIFRVVPNLYCRAGDVEKDNGFGTYFRKGMFYGMKAENFILKHSVPGVLSMVLSEDGEETGQFNIIFKPLPAFNGKHVVFGRIIDGPAEFLKRISCVGMPLGSTCQDLIISKCGIFHAGVFTEGASNARVHQLRSRRQRPKSAP